MYDMWKIKHLEDMIFCKPIKSREAALEIFKIVDDFIKEKNI
jgi:hypothetical protein